MTVVVGLTGGIASGKSLVAQALVRRGALLIDADLIARELVEPGRAALTDLLRVFGDEILDAGGRLRRGRLGALVFADKAALARLNATLHPPITAEIRARVAAARARGERIVVLDAALLVELGLGADCDLVLVVTAPMTARIERMVARDGLSPQAARQRIAAQATDEERLEHADLLVDNGAGLDELERRICSAWDMIEAAAEQGIDAAEQGTTER